MPGPPATQRPAIPITLITGFLGSGKTTILLNLLPQLPPAPEYRLALVKNELGDTAVDSQLASQSGIEITEELDGGCICCNLTGQLGNALEALSAQNVDRIVIETSGSAFPATLALEVNRLAKETSGRYRLDGIVSVVDVVNWKGYEDTSPTARLQARFTDLLILNKWEDAGERRFDDVLELLGALDVEMPKVKSRKGWVAREFLLGIDSKLAKAVTNGDPTDALEAETAHSHGYQGHDSEVEVLSIVLKSEGKNTALKMEPFEKMISSAPKHEVYRIKAIVRASKMPRSSDGEVSTGNGTMQGVRTYILNWAFGRWTFTPMSMGQLLPLTSNPDLLHSTRSQIVLRMTMIFARFESAMWEKRLKAGGIIEPEDTSLPFELKVKLSR